MQHSNLQDYQIFQRDADGFASVRYCGTLDRNLPEEESIIVRVVKEENNQTVIPWTACSLKQGENVCEWSIDLRVPEGGLYRFEATELPKNASPEWSSKIDCLYHLGVGDVYVMAGQSNMTGYGRDSAFDPPTLGVHSFTRAAKWAIAAHPLCDSLDSPYGYCEHGTGTSPALAFARRLHEALNIPIGLIPTAIGGTMLSEWDPEIPGYCYEKMCAMAADAGGFRGMIWFQGCSDANPDLCDSYLERFTRIVGQWREKFGHFPVLTVQLNRWIGSNDGKTDREWGTIREAQRLAALTIPDVSVVPSIDLSVTDGIHNSSGANVIIGERLAETALACVYGKQGLTAPAVLRAERVDETHIRVYVTPGHRVCAMDNVAVGMNIEDESGMINCRFAFPDGDSLVVEAERAFTCPARFHYAWRTQPPVFSVRDTGGMPLLACYGVEILGA